MIVFHVVFVSIFTDVARDTLHSVWLGYKCWTCIPPVMPVPLRGGGAAEVS